jgi:hypothetical protein
MYIIIETHGGAECAIICTDENGNNLVFENYADAEQEAADCQEAFIVAI